MLNNNSQTIKAIIFDCDGTLVESEQFHFYALRDAFQKQGYQLDQDFYSTHFVGTGEQGIVKVTNEILGFEYTPEMLEDKNKFFQSYQEKEGIAPIVATVDLVHSLFQNKDKYGLKLGVASGALKKDILRSLKGIGIEEYFDVILSGLDDLHEYDDPEGVNKPKPYVYLKAAAMLGVKPEECIAVEDSRNGVSAGVSAGCFTIAIPNHYTHNHDLSHAHMRLDSVEGMNVEDFLSLGAKATL